MFKKSRCHRCASSSFSSLLGNLSYGERPRYPQQYNATQKIFPPFGLQKRLQQRPKPTACLTALAELDEEARDTFPALDKATTSIATIATNSVVRSEVAVATCPQDDVEDDVVMDSSTAELDAVTASSSSSAIAAGTHRVGVDVLELVTDEFRKLREEETERRRRILYQLTHPTPIDYLYGGKLVPVPPLSFGQVSSEAKQLGHKVMCEQQYHLVRTAPSTDYFFELNDLYMEIVMVGKANAGKSSLINGLLQQNVAKTSSLPNSTREVSFYQSASPEELNAYANRNPSKLVKLPAGGLQLTFVDLPGFGIAGMSDKWRDNAIAVTDSYLGVRRSVNTVFLCIDCDRGVTKADVTYMEWLENLHGMFWIILTKCDSVPHSRVCSVMRQIYQLITKHRRKFRKVYPFVLPVSAKDGTNMDVLRGLIAETSGLITGDRLRTMLQKKAEKANQEAETTEKFRVWEIWEEERAKAKQLFLQQQDTALNRRNGRKHDSRSNITANARQTLLSSDALSSAKIANNKALLTSSSDSKSSMNKTKITISLDSANPDSENANAKGNNPPKERIRLQYGGPLVKLNTGIESKKNVDIDMGDDGGPSSAEGEGEAGMAQEASTQTLGGVPEGGVVSRFVEKLQAISQDEDVSLRSQKHSHKTRNFFRQRRGKTNVYTQDPGTGLVSRSERGRSVGPSFVDLPATAQEFRCGKGSKLAAQYSSLARKESPTAPWHAPDALRAKEDELKQRAAIGKMSKKDLEAYLKNTGKIVEGFDKFENHVTTTAYQNEMRQVTTLRRREQLHFNSTAKINYRSQPPGLLKDYGGKDTYWPTPRVLGL